MISCLMGSLQVVIFVFVLQQRIFINLHWRVESRITPCRGRVPLSKKKTFTFKSLNGYQNFFGTRKKSCTEGIFVSRGVKGEKKDQMA